MTDKVEMLGRKDTERRGCRGSRRSTVSRVTVRARPSTVLSSTVGTKRRRRPMVQGIYFARYHRSFYPFICKLRRTGCTLGWWVILLCRVSWATGTAGVFSVPHGSKCQLSIYLPGSVESTTASPGASRHGGYCCGGHQGCDEVYGFGKRPLGPSLCPSWTRGANNSV